MPFYCSLCANPDESCYFSPFCSKCLELKKIIDLYGIDQINDSLKCIYVRDKTPINNRTEAVKNNEILKDSVIQTRSKTKPDYGKY